MTYNEHVWTYFDAHKLAFFSKNLSLFWRGILCGHALWIALLTVEQMTSNANLSSDYPSFFSPLLAISPFMQIN